MRITCYPPFPLHDPQLQKLPEDEIERLVLRADEILSGYILPEGSERIPRNEWTQVGYMGGTSWLLEKSCHYVGTMVPLLLTSGMCDIFWKGGLFVLVNREFCRIEVFSGSRGDRTLPDWVYRPWEWIEAGNDSRELGMVDENIFDDVELVSIGNMTAHEVANFGRDREKEYTKRRAGTRENIMWDSGPLLPAREFDDTAFDGMTRRCIVVYLILTCYVVVKIIFSANGLLFCVVSQLRRCLSSSFYPNAVNQIKLRPSPIAKRKTIRLEQTPRNIDHVIAFTSHSLRPLLMFCSCFSPYSSPKAALTPTSSHPFSSHSLR